ncbi:MAG: hypothetical protein GYB66_16215 [Chloroflexi bacterium]|nr:hypothetical protein [Chloroflexota bacterium]
MNLPRPALLALLLCCATLACSLSQPVSEAPASQDVTPVVINLVIEPDGNQPPERPAPITPPPTSTITPFPSATPLPASPTPNATTFVEPAGCQRPSDDYTRITIGNATLNQRTFAMLQYAQELYGGTIPITGAGITQGSYNPGGVAASFGTHDGGGAVDLTVRNIPYDWSIKFEDIPRLIDALRTAGFAAFYRDEREGLPPHIHAIAIGDRELSPAAAEQLTGRYGYFRGFDGFPRENGVPLTPRYGSLVICQWMLDMGFQDMRGAPLPE